MHSPYFTAEHLEFKKAVQDFVEKEVAPYATEWEKKRQIPRATWLRMGELGFLGINHPEEYGGMNADFFYSVIFLETLARCNMGGFMAAISVHQYMSVAHIAAAGSHYLKKNYLQPSIEGTKIGALGITEPSGGSDVGNIKTTAVKDGDHYIINGSKTFITNGVYADFVVVACKTNPEQGINGISLIVVDTNTAGFSANKLEKMGWHSSDTGELFFDNVRVPAHNLVGNENMGFYYIMDSFQLERLVAALGSVGAMHYAIEITLKYIHEREAFGRKISKFQTIRHDLAQITTEIEAAQHLTHHAAWLYQNNHFAVKECSMAKLLTSELTTKVADTCLQCFGGYGYMEEYPLARMYRDARVGTIVGGTSAIMREIIAKILIDNVQYKSVYKNEQTFINQKNNLTNQPQPTQIMSNTPSTAREIILSLPQRYKTEKAPADYSTTVHLNISGDNGGEFTVNIQDGKCSVTEGLIGTPKCTVSATDNNYQDVELGRTNPQMAVMMGKIKLSNIGEMMTFAGLFQRLF